MRWWAWEHRSGRALHRKGEVDFGASLGAWQRGGGGPRVGWQTAVYACGYGKSRQGRSKNLLFQRHKSARRWYTWWPIIHPLKLPPTHIHPSNMTVISDDPSQWSLIYLYNFHSYFIGSWRVDHWYPWCSWLWLRFHSCGQRCNRLWLG
jgi:hypothetical protein